MWGEEQQRHVCGRHQPVFLRRGGEGQGGGKSGQRPREESKWMGPGEHGTRPLEALGLTREWRCGADPEDLQLGQPRPSPFFSLFLLSQAGHPACTLSGDYKHRSLCLQGWS